MGIMLYFNIHYKYKNPDSPLFLTLRYLPTISHKAAPAVQSYVYQRYLGSCSSIIYKRHSNANNSYNK